MSEEKTYTFRSALDHVIDNVLIDIPMQFDGEEEVNMWAMSCSLGHLIQVMALNTSLFENIVGGFKKAGGDVCIIMGKDTKSTSPYPTKISIRCIVPRVGSAHCFIPLLDTNMVDTDGSEVSNLFIKPLKQTKETPNRGINLVLSSRLLERDVCMWVKSCLGMTS